jgi:hypothetical protein
MFVKPRSRSFHGCTFLAVNQLDIGGVILNDSSDFRFVTRGLLFDGT